LRRHRFNRERSGDAFPQVKLDPFLLLDPPVNSHLDRQPTAPQQLPTSSNVPRVALALGALEGRSPGELERACAAINAAPSLAQRVLSRANTWLGLPDFVDSVEALAAEVGLGTLRELVLTCEVFCSADHAELAQRAWHRARLARALVAGTPSAQHAFEAGLLAEVGALQPGAGPRAERGAALLVRWGLAAAVVDAVACQCTPVELASTLPAGIALRLANALLEHDTNLSPMAQQLGVAAQLATLRVLFVPPVSAWQ
jgi:HD-like signal output (HDOD) protein